MSALYSMRFVGMTGAGAGAIYVGRGKLVGIDIADGRYDGTYTQQGANLQGTVSIWMPNGGQLVTGQQLAPGQRVQIPLTMPQNFASGKPQTVTVAGKPVQVVFEKIGDIP